MLVYNSVYVYTCLRNSLRETYFNYTVQEIWPCYHSGALASYLLKITKKLISS